MRKSSLGMRKSSGVPRNNAASHLAKPTPNVSSSRKSGIPIRSRSSETLCQSASSDRARAKSSSRYEMVTPGFSKSAMTPFTPVNHRRATVDRLSRSTTKNQSINQSRRSSVGAGKSRVDDRPLKDKDWQQGAQAKVEFILRQDLHGSQILDNFNGALKPLSLALFIELTNYFIQKIDPSLSVDKHNYVNEITYFCKRLSYRGRVDRSWMISVNTSHSFGHALGLLEYLASIVSICNPPNINDLLFPSHQFEEDNDSFWDFKQIIPLMNNLYINDDEEEKHELIRECITSHVDSEIEIKINEAEVQFQNLNDNCATIAADIEKINAEGSQVHEQLIELEQQLDSEISQSERYREFISKATKEQDMKMASLAALESEFSSLNKEKEKIENAVKTQKLSTKDVENMKKTMSELSQKCQNEKKNIVDYQDKLFQVDLFLSSLKKEAAKDRQELNKVLIQYGTTEPSISQLISSQLELKESLEPIKLAISACLEKYNEMHDTIVSDIKDSHQNLTKLRSSLIEIEEEKKKLKSTYSSLKEELNVLNKAESLKELEEENKKLWESLEKKKEEFRISYEKKETELKEKIELLKNKDAEHKVMTARAKDLFASHEAVLNNLRNKLNRSL